MKLSINSTLPTVTAEVLVEFDRTTEAANPELRELLYAVRQLILPGDDQDTALSPREAAERLGMSRTHLYKRLDRGDVPFHRVGRDRRISLREVIAFKEQRHRDSSELAERFASADQTRAGAIDETVAFLTESLSGSGSLRCASGEGTMATRGRAAGSPQRQPEGSRMIALILASALGVVLSLLGTRWAVTLFAKIGFGQPIRVDGPASHQIKRGTPTMGGLVIILASVLAYLTATFLAGNGPSASGWLALLLFVGCGAVGFLDDYIKVVTQDNRGLSGWRKIAGQAVVALAFGLLATQFFTDSNGVRPASQYLSTTEDVWIKLPAVVILLVIWFLITATSNATNIIDGADGLLPGTAAMVFGGYALINLWQSNQLCGSSRPTLVPEHCYPVRDPLDLAIICAAVAAACIGFLWWNVQPARIIMGDVGSLALGGLLAGVAIMSRTELLLVVLGGVFVMDTMTVIIQTTYFKLTRKLTGTGKRIFPFTPIHHHFETIWGEAAMVIRVWILCGLCVLAGLGIFYGTWMG